MKEKITLDQDLNLDREMLNTITTEIVPSEGPPNLEIVSCFAELATALLHLDKLGLLPSPIANERLMLERKLAEARSLLESAALGRKN